MPAGSKENSQESRRIAYGLKKQKPYLVNSQEFKPTHQKSTNPHTDETRQDRPVRMPTRSEFEHSGPSYREYSDSSYTSDSTLPLSSLTRPKAVHPDVTPTKRVQVTVLKIDQGATTRFEPRQLEPRLRRKKMCLRPQRGAFSGVLHAYTVASKNRCFTTVRSVWCQFCWQAQYSGLA